MNNSIKTYECNINDENRLYDAIKLCVGMPIIICEASLARGYYNGDAGTIIAFDEDDDEVMVRLDRTGKDVWVQFEKTDFEILEDITFNILKFEKDIDHFRFYVQEKDGMVNDYRTEDFFKDEKEFKTGIQTFKRKKSVYYSFMPILPANYLNAIRCKC